MKYCFNQETWILTVQSNRFCDKYNEKTFLKNMVFLRMLFSETQIRSEK